MSAKISDRYIAFISLEDGAFIFLRIVDTCLFAQTIVVSYFSGVCESDWGNYETREIKQLISQLMFEFRTYQSHVLAVRFEITCSVGISELSDSSVFSSVLLPVLDLFFLLYSVVFFFIFASLRTWRTWNAATLFCSRIDHFTSLSTDENSLTYNDFVLCCFES